MSISLKNRFLIGASIALVAFAIFAFNTPYVKAAISNFTPTTCYSASATSSPTYMTPGVATSTTGTGGCFLGLEGARTASLVIQYNASSSATSKFNTIVEESMDGKDWYAVALDQIATTSVTVSPSTKGLFEYTFASSTAGAAASGSAGNHLGVNGTNNRNQLVIDVPTRMKYLRAFTSLQTGGTNGAAWMQIIPRVDTN